MPPRLGSPSRCSAPPILGYFGILSAWDEARTAREFQDAINAELERIPSEQCAQQAAFAALRRHGFGEPNAGGWCEVPRA